MTHPEPEPHPDDRSRPLVRPILFTDSYRPQPGVSVVTIRGEIDLSTEPALRAALTPAITDRRIHTLVCDLSDVYYLSCGGLSVLVQARADLHQRGATLRVVAHRQLVVRVITLTGLAEPLGLRRTLPDTM
ncbi:anti-sigma factor antagonist [Phytohabitans sp. LJ34]|uniref:anti-sigma factor antagonist n=1 Tax=Phytohabitans sp. LJ34 TaxID=3452217 RepID=UPI003F8B89BB